MHAAVDTLGHLLALHVTPADAQDRTEVDTRAAAVQEVTGEPVEVAYVDQGYTGQYAVEAAEAHGIRLEVVKLPGAKHSFVLLPKRWVAERGFAWATASAAPPATTSDFLKSWPTCTSLPSFA